MNQNTSPLRDDYGIPRSDTEQGIEVQKVIKKRIKEILQQSDQDENAFLKTCDEIRELLQQYQNQIDSYEEGEYGSRENPNLTDLRDLFNNKFPLDHELVRLCESRKKYTKQLLLSLSSIN